MLKVKTFSRREREQVFVGDNAPCHTPAVAHAGDERESMRRGFIGGVMVSLTSYGAAAQVAMAPPAQDAAGKQFNPPPTGMAAIYFYNPLTTGPVIKVFE